LPGLWRGFRDAVQRKKIRIVPSGKSVIYEIPGFCREN
jgi:hypothetical protein